LNNLAIGERQNVKLAVFVAECDSLTVGRPFRLVTHRAATGRDLFGRLQTVLRNQINLFFTALVGDKCDL
jgi:hypothetical protein